MIILQDKEKAAKLRRELAAELSKKKPDPEEVKRIRNEIYEAGFRSAVRYSELG
ncbi:MAG: hypothetical protein J6S14_12270 [Clostridia bacterium]|nr:hypothetical protein [Clostridia bacterium]